MFNALKKLFSSKPDPASHGDPSGKGQAVDPATLRLWVMDQLRELVDTSKTFTAYDVTLAVRAAHPDFNIPHYHGVREHVHGLMGSVVLGYQVEMKDLTDKDGQPYQAWVYSPVS